VTIERRRIELREDENPPHVGVQAVADRDVNETIFAANRNGRLGTLLRERKQPAALASAKDDRQDLRVDGHSNNLQLTTDK